MPKGLKGWIAVFKTGRHPGKGAMASHEFTRQDLDQMAGNLSDQNPVPHVITHEERYSPFAYAHGVEAKRDGDTLYVRSEKVNPDLESLIESGALYSRSVRIIKDAVKGFCLDHIAWLGAEPPAVSGLAPVEFSKNTDAFTDFHYVDTQTPFSMKRLARSIREFLVDKFDIETADQVVPEHEIESMEWQSRRSERAVEESMKAEADESPANFSKSKTGGESVSKYTQEDIDKAAADAKAEAKADYQKKLDEQAATFAAERQLNAKKDWEARVADAVKAGTVTPAQAEGMVEFACSLQSDNAVSFSRHDADGKETEKVEVAPDKWFADFVAALPKQVAIASAGTTTDVSGDDAVDTTDAGAIAQAATSYQKEQAAKGITVSISDAVGHVTAKKEGA